MLLFALPSLNLIFPRFIALAQPSSTQVFPQIAMNNFTPANPFNLGTACGMQQQQHQTSLSEQFCEDNISTNNVGLSACHLPQQTMLDSNSNYGVRSAMSSTDHGHNNNSPMMTMSYPPQTPMPLLTSQQQQAVMNLVLQQHAQQLQQQQQRQQNQQYHRQQRQQHHQQQEPQQQQQQQLMATPDSQAGPTNAPAIQQKATISSSVNPANYPAKVGLSNFLEPRPIGVNVVVRRASSPRPERKQRDYVAPLRASPPRKPKLRNDDSCSSLMVDSIFTDKSRSTTKFNNSALSITSLSVNTIGIETSDREEDDPGDLCKLFDSSLKLSHQSSNNSLATRPKASKSMSKGNANTEDSIQERGMASVLEMSLNTIGDEMSEFGDSYAIMADSQAEMSLANVFGDSFR